MKANRVALFTGLVLMLVAPVLCSGCGSRLGSFVADSAFAIVGKAYEWVNPPPGAAGAVFYKEGEGEGRSPWDVLDEMEKEAFQKYELAPLEGVKVVAAPDYGGVWSLRAVSDGQGFLAGGQTIPTYGADWGFIFSKSGYVEVTLEIKQDSLNYALVVIMVREDSPNQVD